MAAAAEAAARNQYNGQAVQTQGMSLPVHYGARGIPVPQSSRAMAQASHGMPLSSSHAAHSGSLGMPQGSLGLPRGQANGLGSNPYPYFQVSHGANQSAVICPGINL